MKDINDVMLVGNLGEDAQARSFQNGGGSVSFSVATHRRWKDRASGEWKEALQWHRVVLYDDRARQLAQNARKGDRVMVRGELQTRKYNDRLGHDQRITEIVVQPFAGHFEFMDAARARRELGDGADPGAPPLDLDDASF